MPLQLTTIISGGQCGADVSSLRAAKRLGLKTGGYAPKGWLTHDGPKPSLQTEFGLIECCEPGYGPRTDANVRTSDATVRFAKDFQSPGEKCTLFAIHKYSKPSLAISWKMLCQRNEYRILFVDFLIEHSVKVLNCAGNSTVTAGVEIESLVETFIYESLAPFFNQGIAHEQLFRD